MFEKAVRMKLRWQWRGPVSTEDLWDLTVEELDAIYKALNRQVKAQVEDSLLDDVGLDEALNLQVAIVKHVVSVKLQEAKDRENEAERKARKQKLLSVLSQKQDAALLDMSEDDLRKLLLELDH